LVILPFNPASKHYGQKKSVALEPRRPRLSRMRAIERALN